MNKPNSKLALIAAVAALFGLFSGLVGALLAQAYTWGRAYSIPLFGDVRFDRNSPASPGAIITRARNVTVEQDTMAQTTAAAVRSGLVGFFARIPVASTTAPEAVFDPSKAYRLDNELGQGFVLTTDGWVVSAFAPPGLAELPATATGTARAKAVKKLSDAYVAVTAGKRVFTIDNIVPDQESGFVFWHLAASDLSVRRLARDQEISAGQTAVAANWDGLGQLTTVVGLSAPAGQYRSSDRYSADVILEGELDPGFRGAYLFSLSGDLIGLAGLDGRVRSVGSLSNCLDCLMKEKRIRRPVLGISYLGLDRYAGQPDAYAKGALVAAAGKEAAVAKGSPAEKAGLKAGDVVLTVNNIEIADKNDLSLVVSQFIPGQEIELSFMRAGKRETLKAVLGAR